MKIAEDINKIKNINTNIKEIRNSNTVLWPSFDDVIGAPGNRKLLAGNMQAGWFGEVPSSDFITGDALAKLVGITSGISQYSNEPWLKFAYKGDVYLVVKKPIRYQITWIDINAANCVYGDKTIDINGKTYQVMLMRGIGEDVQPNPKTLYLAYDGAACHNSMWNKLMLPIHQKAPSSWAYKNNVKSPTENWNVGYTDADLITNSSNGNGSFCWCQEVIYQSQYRSMRGSRGVSFATASHLGDIGIDYGWRPALKLIG